MPSEGLARETARYCLDPHFIYIVPRTGRLTTRERTILENTTVRWPEQTRHTISGSLNPRSGLMHCIVLIDDARARYKGGRQEPGHTTVLHCPQDRGVHNAHKANVALFLFSK